MSELTALLSRLSARDPYLACGVELGEGRDPDLLLTPTALAGTDGTLERLADAYGDRWGVAGDRCSQASFVVLDYSWYAFAPMVAAYLTEGLVPSLDGAAVWLDPETRLGALVLSPSASIRAGEAATLRSEIVEHMAPIIDAIGDRRWIGTRTAWWGTGDRVAGAFEYIGGLIGQEEGARQAVEELLGPSDTPLESPRYRFTSYEHRGQTRTIGLRASCCRFYRVPGNEYCLTCPVLREPRRLERIAAEIDEELATVVPAAL